MLRGVFSTSLASLIAELSDIANRNMIAHTAFAGEWVEGEREDQGVIDAPSDGAEGPLHEASPAQLQEILNREEALPKEKNRRYELR